LVSERPIGIFLSGGIDSSLVTAIAVKELGSVQTFSIGFQDSRFDESGYARSIAKCLGTLHHEKILSPNPLTVVQDIARVLDQPFADSSIVPTFEISKFARENIVVALSGDGGDEAFGGYDRYRINHYLSRLNAALFLNPLAAFGDNFNSESRRGKLLRASRPADPISRYLELQAAVSPRVVEKLTKNRVNLSQYLKTMPESVNVRDSDIRLMQLMDLKSYLPGDLLYKVDIASMANGLEVRSPLLDYRVVEFGLSLPSQFKVNLVSNKLLLRKVLSNFLPEHLFERPKRGFGIPRADWLRQDLKPLVQELLLNKNARINDWVDKKEVRNLVADHMQGRNREASIWALLMLELWAVNWLN
jgi:asparagine synthase (glutamine-hydrolysing)